MARSDRTEPLPLKPTTIALIREKAGTMPAAQIAREIGWTPQRLARVCEAHGIDVRLPNIEAQPQQHERA